MDVDCGRSCLSELYQGQVGGCGFGFFGNSRAQRLAYHFSLLPERLEARILPVCASLPLAKLDHVGCDGLVTDLASMAERRMQATIKKLLFKALLIFPVCLAVWYGLGDLQVKAAGHVAGWVLPHLHPFARYIIEIHGKEIQFLMLVPPNAPDPGWVKAGTSPLIQLSGLPLYVALMLASPNVKQYFKQLLLGLAFVFLIDIAGLMAQVSHQLLGGLQNMNVDLNKLAQLPNYASRISAYLDFLSLWVTPLFLPVAVWALQRRDFISDLISDQDKTQAQAEQAG